MSNVITKDAAATEGCAAVTGYVACRIYADAEKDALMQALFNLSEADKDGAPYPADDMIYCVLETTLHTQLISNLVDELHKLGYAICPHTHRSPMRRAQNSHANTTDITALRIGSST